MRLSAWPIELSGESSDRDIKVIKNVGFTAKLNLCCGCGVCKGICPMDCISWDRNKGLYVPDIDDSKCIACTKCIQACPGLGHIFENAEKQQTDPLEAVLGSYMYCVNAWSRDSSLRFSGASGGVITTLVKKLLFIHAYDIAFMLQGYNYRSQLKTDYVTKEDMLCEETGKRAEDRFQKSRYLPVSHERVLQYLKKNKNSRVILIGSPCALRGLTAAVRQMNISMDGILKIGLFCDKVYNYNIQDYYEKADFNGGKWIESFHFKNKESGGWPGNMKFVYEGSEVAYIDKKERVKVKDYFMPERCLYCIDKLNATADISTGDNYTEKDSSEQGSNSVIIRTEKGKTAWKAAAEEIEERPAEIRDLIKAQYLDGRLNNLYFASLKEEDILKETGERVFLNKGVKVNCNPGEYTRARKVFLNRLRIGEKYPESENELLKALRERDMPPKRKSVFRKAAGKLYRTVRGKGQ